MKSTDDNDGKDFRSNYGNERNIENSLQINVLAALFVLIVVIIALVLVGLGFDIPKI